MPLLLADAWTAQDWVLLTAAVGGVVIGVITPILAAYVTVAKFRIDTANVTTSIKTAMVEADKSRLIKGVERDAKLDTIIEGTEVVKEQTNGALQKQFADLKDHIADLAKMVDAKK